MTSEELARLPEPIQKIDELYYKATSGEWGWCVVEDEDGFAVPDYCIYAKPGPTAAILNVYNDGEPEAPYNRELVIELHNNWPDIVAHMFKAAAELAEAQAEIERLKATRGDVV